jgi:hypothetical protein
VNAGAGVVAAIAAVGILVVGMVTLAAGFAADVQASIDAVRTDIQASVDAVRADIDAVGADIDAVRVESDAAHAEIRASIEAAQVENRAAHAELDRKIENVGENLGERIDRLHELLLAQADQ